MLYSLLSSLRCQQLLRKFGSLRTAFQKLDSNHDGFLEPADFVRVLETELRPNALAAQDLYHLLTEFDVNLDGRVSYREFLNALIQ